MDDPTVAASRALLRQLAIGLSVHRLYPDNSNVPSFLAAAERIRSASDAALVSGPVRLEVRSGRFRVGDEPITGEGVDRLAHACFERRVELVEIDAVPTVAELGHWFTLLSSDVSDLERDGGMEAALFASDVTSIRASARAPVPAVDDATPRHLGLADHPVPHEVRKVDEDIDDLELLPGEGGAALFRRLVQRTAAAGAPSTPTTFYRRAAALVDDLPAEERAVFGARLFEGLETVPFAEHYAGHLTDVALARLISEVAYHTGRDPGVLASEVAVTAARHGTLRGLLAGNADEPIDTRHWLGQEPAEDERLRADFPDTAEGNRTLASLALIDVMLAGPREEHLVGILDNVTDQLREHVRQRAEPEVHGLLEMLDTAAAVVPAGLAPRLDQPRRTTLTIEVVAAAIAAGPRTSDDGDARLFAPFGTSAIEPLLGALARDLGTPAASRLVDTVVSLGVDHLDDIETSMSAHGPAVIARLIPVIGRTHGPAADTLLARLARRNDPVVLTAVVNTVAHRDPAGAVPIIAGIAGRTTDHAVRDHCLDALSHLPSRAGVAQLEELASRRNSPRLPWRVRRRARRLARTAGGRR